VPRKLFCADSVGFKGTSGVKALNKSVECIGHIAVDSPVSSGVDKSIDCHVIRFFHSSALSLLLPLMNGAEFLAHDGFLERQSRKLSSSHRSMSRACGLNSIRN
jgi:hypothetical protein